MQAHTGQQTLKLAFFGFLYSHLCHVYEALSLPQIISVPHPPMDNSPNPFRGKMQWLWLQSSSSISSSIAKLRTIKQPSISALLVTLLLQHCKRKKKVGVFGGFCLFFYDEAATVWRKLVLCTHRKARISYGALQAARNRKQLEENGYREMVLLGIICWFVLFIEGMRFLSLLKI